MAPMRKEEENKKLKRNLQIAGGVFLGIWVLIVFLITRGGQKSTSSVRTDNLINSGLATFVAGIIFFVIAASL
jgi:hypothetical protein